MKQVNSICYGFALIFILFGFTLSVQPDNSWYKSKLDAVKEQNTFEARQPLIKELLKNENRLKSTFVGSYLAKYRFLGDKNINFIEEGYKQVLNYPDFAAKGIQGTFSSIALPFVYQGNFDEDSEKAVTHYEEIFDSNIQDGERAVIASALKATNTRDEIKAGLLDKDKKTVRIKSKKINVIAEKNSPFAQVSIEEEFENTTNDIQEVYYEFSLPSDSVITGMQLGPNLEYTAKISPKGAARRTYEKQVRQQIDPALLEQTGPRQYRMRIFPIPQKRIRAAIFSNGWIDNPNQKIKYEYIVFKDKNGIALPQINQARNVFSDKKTSISYLFNNNKLNDLNNSSVQSIPISNQEFILTKPQYARINSGYISFIPYKQVNTKPKNLKIAFLLDASYSSRNINWPDYLKNNLPINQIIQDNQIDAYFFNYEISRKINLNKEFNNLKNTAPIAFGKTKRLNALQSIPHDYNMALMFTDSSDFDEYQKLYNNASSLPFPVYIIHADKIIPQYIDNLTIELIKNKGEVLTEAKDAFELYLLQNNQNLSAKLKIIDIDRHGIWLITKDKPKGVGSDILLNVMATNKLIKSMIREQNTNELQVLEDIHSLVKKSSIVTPYSSLIALVNQSQQEELKKAEKGKDKFNADYDIGKEQLANPSGEAALNVSSVPEPEEWISMITVFIMIILFYNKRRIRCLLTR